MFGHDRTTGRCGESHSSGDIERVSTIASGAAGIDHEQLRPGSRQGASLAQDLRHSAQFCAIHTPCPQRRQEPSGLYRGEFFSKPGLH